MRTQFTLDTEDRLTAWLGKCGEAEAHLYLDLYTAADPKTPILWFCMNTRQAFTLMDNLEAALSEIGEP